MDKTCEILHALSHWVGRQGELPVLFAQYQRIYSANRPDQSLIGLVFQDGAGIEGWTIGDHWHPFPDLHAAILHTHKGSHSDELTGRGGIWLTSMDIRGVGPLEDLLTDYGFPAFPVHQPDALRRVYTRIIELYSRPALATRGLHLKAAWLELIACFLDEATGQGDRASLDPPPAVRAVLELIAARYADPSLALADLAAAANLDRHHLGRLCKRYLGSPPMQHLRDYRLQQARYLLSTTDLRISEVAAAVGIADPLHFSRLFRRATGLSPSDYRAAGRTDRSFAES